MIKNNQRQASHDRTWPTRMDRARLERALSEHEAQVFGQQTQEGTMSIVNETKKQIKARLKAEKAAAVVTGTQPQSLGDAVRMVEGQQAATAEVGAVGAPKVKAAKVKLEMLNIPADGKYRISKEKVAAYVAEFDANQSQAPAGWHKSMVTWFKRFEGDCRKALGMEARTVEVSQ